MVKQTLARLMFLLVLISPCLAQIQFTCYPVGSEETPPNSSTGWGVGRFVLNADQDTLYYSMYWTLQNPYLDAHIHAGPPGVQGPPVYSLNVSPSVSAAGAHGVWAIEPTNLDNLLSGNLYVNVHSVAFPNGEIRAQILQDPLQQQDAVYSSLLAGSNEVPPNPSTGWGIGLYRLSPDMDSLYYAFMWRMGDTYLASQIQAGLAGQIGAPVHTLANGDATGSHGAWAIDPVNLNALNSEGLYVNVQSSVFPDGEIRDQIHSEQPVPHAIISPEGDFLFPATYVGDSTELTFTITNTGGAPLSGHFEDLERLQPVFDIDPQLIEVPPGGVIPFTIIFLPSFDHDFAGDIRIASNDPDPVTVVHVEGTGCHVPAPPTEPMLRSAGSPYATYFSIPWDVNDESLLYAVEYSSDGFVTSHFADELGYSNDTPQWSTAGMWGLQGSGAILDLQPDVAYQVRLHTMDCTGAEFTGPSAEITTPAEIPQVDETGLVVHLSDQDQNDVVLRWNKVVRNANGDTLPAPQFEVYHTLSLADSYDLISLESDGEFTYHTGDETVGFFKVVPIIEDFGQPSPFISWPPDGATVSGSSRIVLSDALHLGQWEGFELYVDSDPNPIGTQLDDPVSEAPIPEVTYDFGQLSPGSHVLSGQVQVGNSILPLDPVVITVDEERPYVSFDATYDSLLQRFTCDTINGINMQNAEGIWWQNTLGQQGYNRTFAFGWEGPDSVVLVKPMLIPTSKVLTDDSPTEYLYPDEFAGLTPTTGAFKWPWIEISCCCQSVDMSASGTAEGTYHGQAGRQLGPFVRCQNGDYSVSYAFEVVVTFWYTLVEEGGTSCSWGQDCKRTDVKTVGNCVAGAFVPFVSADGHQIVRTSHKKDGNTEYPNSGDSFGNDHYGNRPGDTGMDNSELGKSRWYDRPDARGSLPTNNTSTFAIRCQRDATFLAKAVTPCEEGGCCETWELHWDVTFCEDCSDIQTVPPAITNYISPVSCPALAQ